MLNLKEIDRNKAKFAFDSIYEAKGIKNFKSNIKNIPMYIYTNGLISTILFIMKKSKVDSSEENDKKSDNTEKEGYVKIGNILLEYIKNNEFNNYNFNGKKLEDFIKYLIDCNSKKYRRITLDVLSILEWLVRFADGMIEEEQVI